MRLNPIVNNILNKASCRLPFSGVSFGGASFGGCDKSQKAHIGHGEFENRRQAYDKSNGDVYFERMKNVNDNPAAKFVPLKRAQNDGFQNLAAPFGEVHREKIKDDEILYVISNPKDKKPLGYAILMFNPEYAKATASVLSKDLQEYYSNAPHLKKIITYKFDEDGEELGLSGVGTNLVKCAVKESIKQGYDGRISVLACDVKDPENAPTIFYHKLGFKFVDERSEKVMAELEKEGRLTTENAADKGVNIGIMYLPKENIPKLLNM